MADQLQPGQSQSQGQTIRDREQARNSLGNGALGETSGAGSGLSVSDPQTPDTRIADANDPSLGTSDEIERDAAEAVFGGDSGVVTPPVPVDQPVDQADARDDPLSQTGTYEGKKVFRPNELNQAGEDKEYFHPDDHHRFRVPNDAQHHVLKPDVTLTPGETPNVELKTDK
jgi:hypothetical protein